jgi:hypothetical protein
MSTPEMSPEEWRSRLIARLLLQIPDKLRWSTWYAGTQAAPVVAKRYANAYRLLQTMTTNSWGGLVVDALAQRLKIEGIVTGDRALDVAAWRIFRANHLDADQRLAFTDALTTGHSYLSVWSNPADPDTPRILPESSLTMTHEVDPEDRRRPVAALKLWHDSLAHAWNATLYKADGIWKWTAPFEDKPGRTITPTTAPHAPVDGLVYLTGEAAKALEWDQRSPTGEPWPAPNPLGEVPIVPLVNRPTLHQPERGISEIAALEPVLSRTDKLTLDMLLASDFAAFRQKWAAGLEVPTGEDGKPIEPYTAAVDRVWVSTSPDTKFGSFDATDLRPYQQVIDAAKADISAISRVPSYYLVSPSLVNPPSAEAIIAAETGLVTKVTDQQDVFGEAWEHAFHLALRIAKLTTLEDQPPFTDLLWRDPATRNEAAQADAALKKAQLGIPQQALWRDLGATPEEIARWSAERVAEEATALILAAASTTADAGPTPGPPAAAEALEAGGQAPPP